MGGKSEDKQNKRNSIPPDILLCFEKSESPRANRHSDYKVEMTFQGTIMIYNIYRNETFRSKRTGLVHVVLYRKFETALISIAEVRAFISKVTKEMTHQLYKNTYIRSDLEV
jgi:Pyruvate/2-oxoacid:ferredoxin oxidoreductase gamma subunit